ncbi:efflux RND transporter periplasmic adaptor subunit [Planctomycetaceae bacterium SH139]
MKVTFRQKRRGVWLGCGTLLVLLISIPAWWQPPLSGEAAAGKRASGPGLEPHVEGQQVPPLIVDVLRLGKHPSPQGGDVYRGTLAASKQSDLAFRRSGRLLRVLVEEGDRVSAGALLAELDMADVQAAIAVNRADQRAAEAVLKEMEAGPRAQVLAAAEAEVERWEAVEGLALSTLGRESELMRASVGSAQIHDQARFGLLQQQAALEAARQTLSELRAGTRPEQLEAQRARLASLQAQQVSLEVNLRDSQILAPYDGLIASRFLDEGTVAEVGQPVLTILQVDPLEARFGVSAEDAAELSVGQQVAISFGDRLLKGEVARLAPQLNPNTRTQEVFVRLQAAEQDSAVIPGQTVSLEIRPNSVSNSGYWVPISALARSSRGLWSVLAITPVGDSAGDSAGESAGESAVPGDTAWNTAAERAAVEAAATWELQRHDVRVLEMTASGARIEGSSLTAGLAIVRSGLHRVLPGMQVQPNEEIMQPNREKSSSP